MKFKNMEEGKVYTNKTGRKYEKRDGFLWDAREERWSELCPQSIMKMDFVENYKEVDDLDSALMNFFWHCNETLGVGSSCDGCKYNEICIEKYNLKPYGWRIK